MTKKAVLVGINKYVAFPDNCLNGCVNDILDMRDALINHYEFNNDNIRVVTDERATKQNIMDRLHWLISDIHEGDTILFHYSGHGSQVRLRDNSGKLNSYLDELICPTNMNFDDPSTFIIDREFRDLFNFVPQGVIFDVVFDCCHSGSGTRDLLNPMDEHKCKSKFLEPPLDFKLRDSGDLETNRIFGHLFDHIFKADRAIQDPMPKSHVLNAACRVDQTSADAFLDGRYNGAFTYYFLKLLHQNSFKLTRSTLSAKTAQSLKVNGFSQKPQLEGPSERKGKFFLS